MAACATFARLFPVDHLVLLRHHSQQRRFLRFQYRVRRAYQLMLTESGLSIPLRLRYFKALCG